MSDFRQEERWKVVQAVNRDVIEVYWIRDTYDVHDAEDPKYTGSAYYTGLGMEAGWKVMVPGEIILPAISLPGHLTWAIRSGVGNDREALEEVRTILEAIGKEAVR